jgi:SAM-dependent methyltransferase
VELARGRFVRDRPQHVRKARRRDWYYHHVTKLPARLEVLSRQLGVRPGDTVLDYGCADLPYRRFFPDDVEYVAADLPGNPSATLELNADASVPLPSGSVDAVLSTQVLEHVTDPALYLAECHRVLRPGGRLLLSTHGIFVYHPDPVDLWRWTCAGLQHEVRRAGLEVVGFEGIIGLGATGIQLFQDSMAGRVPARLRSLFAVCMQGLVVLTDRFEGQWSRDYNAQVFAVLAERP